MTPEQLEKGMLLKRLINSTEKTLTRLEHGYSTIALCAVMEPGLDEFIDVTESVEKTIKGMVMADLKSRLESLQKEFDEL